MATRKQLEQALNNPKVRQFLDLIAHTEGTEGNGYRTAFGGGRLGSLNDHPRYMKSFTQQNGKTNKTSAAGRYQFLSSTWDGVARQYGLNDFSPRNQDLGAVALLAQNGALGDILKGDMTGAVRKSGRTWASLPTAPASYSQPTKSWKTVNKFLGGDYQPSQQQPQADPRLSMSAPDLLATLRKGEHKRTDLQILYELSNNNGLAGREINALLAQGENINDIANQLGLKVPEPQQQAVEPPSFEEFSASYSNPIEPPSFEEFSASYEPEQETIPVEPPSFEEFSVSYDQSILHSPTQTSYASDAPNTVNQPYQGAVIEDSSNDDVSPVNQGRSSWKSLS